MVGIVVKLLIGVQMM